MRKHVAAILAVALVGVVTIAVSQPQGAGAQMAPTKPRVTRADIDKWKTEYSNWGRWGKDDQIGPLNLITPAKRKAAAALVKDGVSVSLAHDAVYEKAIDAPTPYQRIMTSISGDRLEINFHGYIHTHVDSLAHSNDNGKFYNGYQPQEAVVMKEGGHQRNSVYNLKNGVFTRGVLMDIAALKGVPYLEPGTHIYPEDLEAWEKRAGVKVGPGDAMLIRTGRWARRAKLGPWDVTKSAAGLDASCIPWLKQRDVAVLVGEVPQDVVPQGENLGLSPGSTSQLVVHGFTLVYLGAQLIDNADLDAVAEAAAARNRWDFLFTLQPLPLRGGTGSPANPMATF